MSSHFSAAQDRVPPLVDIPAPLASMVLYGGLGLAEAEARYAAAQQLGEGAHRRPTLAN